MGFAAFAPWIIFWVVAGPSTWEYAAGGALLAALILAVPDAQRGSLKLLDLTSLFLFAVLTALGLILDPSELDWLEEWAQALSTGVLAVVIIGTLPFMPFTEQYAREQAPRQVWDSPEFKRRNLLISAVWGAAFLGVAICGVVAHEVSRGDAWFAWIIPVALIVGAFKYTAATVGQARSRAAVA